MRCLTLLSLLTTAIAWRLHISPNGERLLNRKAGDNFLVVCSVQDYDGAASDAKVEWYKGDQQIKMGRVMAIPKPNSNQLMIVKARQEDSGTFTCRTDIAGQTQEASAEITFIRPPEFVDPKTEQHPEDGVTAEIECKVEGEDGLDIFWQFNGNTLEETDPRGYEFKDNNQILVIPNYDSKRDDGIYLCNAAQHASFETLTINVSGYSRPQITVFESPANGRGLEGHSAEFKCQAIGKPKPTYKWFRLEDNEEIESSDLYTLDDGLLVISSLSSADAGEYRCEASNAIGSDNRTASVTVFLRPKVEKIANATHEEKSSVEFVCRYSGEGDVKAKFLFGDQEYAIRDSEESVVTELNGDVDEDEDDDVDGAADDDHDNEGSQGEDDEKRDGEDVTGDNDKSDGIDDGDDKDADDDENEEDDEKEVDISAAREDDPEPLDDNAQDGDSDTEEDDNKPGEEDTSTNDEDEDNERDEVELDGHHHEDDNNEDEHRHHEHHQDDHFGDVEAQEEEDDHDEDEDEDKEETEDHEEVFRWKRDIASGRVSVRAEGDNMIILTVNDLTQSDAGAYQCIVENEAGSVTRTSHLAITHAPVIHQHTDGPVRSFEGNDVELHCFAKAVPDPKWTWTFENRELEADGSAVRIDSHGDRTILNLRTTDGKYGTYACKADNQVGAAAIEEIEVIQVLAPSKPTVLTCQDHVYPNYGSCSFGSEEYQEENTKPTEVEFFYAPADDVDSDYDWLKDAMVVKVPYSEKMKISGLRTNTNYVVRARVINEAGQSELGVEGTIETTDPWAPERPESVTVECDDVCMVSWIEPNDHGSDITGYKIAVREYTQEENDDEKIFSGKPLEVTVDADDEAVELTHLMPSTRYEVSVVAFNTIGSSDSKVTFFETPASLTPAVAEGFTSLQLIIIVVAVLFAVLTIVDLICFATNRCGLIACICINCLGRSPDRKQKDLESGKPESNRLLGEGATR